MIVFVLEVSHMGLVRFGKWIDSDFKSDMQLEETQTVGVALLLISEGLWG